MLIDEPFWQTLHSRGDNLAVVDTESSLYLTYIQLHARVQQASELLSSRSRSLVWLCVRTDLGGIVCYLGALNAGHAVFLCPANARDAAGEKLIQKYRPEIIMYPADLHITAAGYAHKNTIEGYCALTRTECTDAPPNRNLALVLSTSASTGDAKSVRLSSSNLVASADRVAEALGVNANDRSLMGLPLSYVYGLSVLHSSLVAGGAVALTKRTWMDRTLYNELASIGVTSIAGVTQTFEYMQTLNVRAAWVPTLKRLTHAGGPLPPALFFWIYDRFGSTGVDIYLMYGQTEAGGRITVLNPSNLPQLNRSVGKPMRSGTLSIGDNSEIIHSGPCVMMGYARSRSDLGHGDTLRGVLHTGDTGYVDVHGNLFITGRINRYTKVFGLRINLDNVEDFLRREQYRAAVLENNGLIKVFVESNTLAVSTELAIELAREFRLPPQTVEVHAVTRLPRSDRGKIDYDSLRTVD